MSMIGRMLNRYRIESTLGEGGMGIVYKARDTQLDRTVAIKVLPQDKLADRVRQGRFVLEAKAASALNHPGIVAVHDIRSDDGVEFIVMEYVSGQTLDQVISSTGLPVKRALRYGAAIADALSKAHEAGIVHRDLKPSNVMVTDSDGIKILDFGVAKLLEPSSDQLQATTQASLTETGLMVGTAAYMSPEQIRGDKIDARSDVFSFGVVLYEMVAGRRPFTADSHVGIMASILNDEPLAPSHHAAVPSDVDRTILRCLRKDPARRYQTMADLKVALEDLAADPAEGLQTPSLAARPPRRWRWAWAALVPALVAVAYVSWPMLRSAETAIPLRAVPLTSLTGVTRSPSFSPDGNHVAFAWTGPDGTNQDIYVQQIGAGSHLRLTSDPANDYSPLWSPDGRWIAFLRAASDGRSHELRLVPPLTGPERKVTEIRPRGFLRPVTLSWCPDSTCVVVTDSLGDGQPDALFVVSLDSREKRPLTTPPASILADSDPAISPDGRWLVFRRDVAPFAGSLHLLPLHTNLTAAGEARLLVPITFYAYSPSWMPDSSEIVFSARSALWRLRISGEGTPERLPFVGEDGLTPIVSRAQADRPARLAYVRSYRDTNIWRLDTPSPGAPAPSPPVLAISSTRRDAVAHIAPDGNQVTFASNRSGENEIWRAAVSGAGAVQLTSMSLNPSGPRWSPDGELIAFHTNGVNGSGDVFIVPAEGGQPRNLTSHPASDAFPTFSRDGRWIYFSSARSGRRLIWKIPISGGDAVQVTQDVGHMAMESPDQAYIYYTESENANSPAALWRLPTTGGAAVKMAEGVISTSFDVVDQGIYYIERLGPGARLQYLDLASRNTITVAENLGRLDFGLAASPDGRTLLFTREDSSVNDVMLVESFR